MDKKQLENFIERFDGFSKWDGKKQVDYFAYLLTTEDGTESFTAKQIQFLQTLQTFIVENGALTKRDLVQEPFTKIHENGFLGLFDKHMQVEILNFTNQIFAYA